MDRVSKVVHRYRENGRDAAIQLLLMPSFRAEMKNLPDAIREDLEGAVLQKLARRKKKKASRREHILRERDQQIAALVRRTGKGQNISKSMYYGHPTVREAVMEQVPEYRKWLECELDRRHRAASLTGETPYRYCNDKFSESHPVVDVLHDAVFTVFKDTGCDPDAANAALIRGAEIVRAGGDEKRSLVGRVEPRPSKGVNRYRLR